MDSAARTKLAADLAARMSSVYGEAILVGGVYGSTARGDDTAWSDLDMLFITGDSAKLSGQHFLFHGIAVGFQVVTASELEAELQGPGANWPFWMGVLEVCRPLAGDPRHIERWRKLGMALDDEQFLRGAARHLPGLVFESFGRIRSCAVRNNERDAIPAAHEVVFEMVQALCLLNRRWVTRDYYGGVEQSFSFPHRPEGFETLALALLAARELSEIVVLAGQLVSAYWRLLIRRNMVVQNYQRVEQVPL